MTKQAQPRSYGLSFLILGAAAMAGAAAAGAAENYPDWAHSSDLILDTSPAGAGVTGTVTEFPLLLRLTSANFSFGEAKGRGQDFRVSRADGKPLRYQIERWDSTKAVAEIWIKADTVLGNTAGQTLRVYWGNAAAADSSNGGAVFQTHYVAAWHMGGNGSDARPNSVTGGQPATPVNFDGDESRPGIIGLADSLDGGSPGDYLDIGDGYADFSTGFMFSVWAYPTAMKTYARLLELGNGENADNIMLVRDSTTDNLRFDNYNPGANVGTVRASSAISLNQWQLFTVTVSGSAVKLYKNGAVVSTGTLSNSISGNWRASNFLGKSNWSWDSYFQGIIDEPEISNYPHSDSWVKLTYQNQKAGQTLVTLKASGGACVEKFKAPADTSIAEGGSVTLSGIADCATAYSWSAISGPAPRMLDPEVKNLSIVMPRVAGDTALVYRFTATFAASAPYKDVRVTIKEKIPEPAFTFPSSLTWNGADSVALRPVISNLAAIKASRDTAIHWAWTLTGADADTSWLKDGLMLRKASAEGSLQVGLCLDNSGPSTCHNLGVTVSAATAGLLVKKGIVKPGATAAIGNLRDTMGRWMPLHGNGGNQGNQTIQPHLWSSHADARNSAVAP
jgi:hypothetical protein